LQNESQNGHCSFFTPFQPQARSHFILLSDLDLRINSDFGINHFHFSFLEFYFLGVLPFPISIILPTGEKVKLFFEIFSSISSPKGKGGLTPPFNYLLCEFFQPVDIAVKPRHGNPSCVACSFRVYQVHCVDDSVFGVFLLLQVEEIPHEDTTVVTFSVYLNPSAFSFPNFVLFP